MTEPRQTFNETSGEPLKNIGADESTKLIHALDIHDDSAVKIIVAESNVVQAGSLPRSFTPTTSKTDNTAARPVGDYGKGEGES